MGFPNTPLLDDFNRTTLGPNWTNSAFGDGACSINTNQLAGAAATANGCCWTAQTFNRDQEVYLDVPTVIVGAAIMDIIVRASATSGAFNCYLLRYTPSTTTMDLRKITAGGSSVSIGTFSSSISLANGDSYGLQAIGSVFTAWKKTAGLWAQVGGVISDSTFLTPGFIAIEFETTAARMDNFGGGNFGTTTVELRSAISHSFP